MATVILYGLGAGPLARRLGLAESNQQGVLIVGAGAVEQSIARALHDSGISIVMATTNRTDEYRARMDGLQTFYGNVLDEDIDLELELSGIGRLLALTPNDEVNTLACQRFTDVFGGAETYQLPTAALPAGIETSRAHLGGRTLFGDNFDYETLRHEFESGVALRRTQLSEPFGADDLMEQEGRVRPVFVVRNDRLRVVTADTSERALSGHTLIWLAVSEPESA
jgi:voltage-gated potassium channel Kch